MNTMTHLAPEAVGAGGRRDAAAGPGHPDPYQGRAAWVLGMLVLTLPVVLGLITAATPEPPGPPVNPWTEEAAALGVAPDAIANGMAVFRRTCAVCHGQDGEGLRRLGKPLRNSAFVQEHGDEALFQLIAEGRAPSDPDNTTGALMPARGAQNITDAEIHDVVAYLRAMQDPSQPTVSIDAWLAGSDTDAGGVAVELAEHPGYELFLASCASCHGEGGQGMENFGLPLTTSGFVRGKTDQELITFIKTGRPMWNENNVTGLDMPPKGGNPAITDDELQTIVEYIRALQEAALNES